MARRLSRKLTPGVTRLESREVLSRATHLAHLVRPSPAPAAPIAFGAQTTAVSAQAPTAQELARERFVARATRVQVGEGGPRFTDQSAQFLYAGSGVSTQSRAMRFVMRLYTPLDPNSQVVGIAAIRDRNVATTGTILLLDLAGSTANLDAQGRPTRLTWTVDGNSAGYYAGATSVDATGAPGTGTLDVYYAPNRSHAPHGGINAGSATVIAQGLIRTNEGVTQVTAFELGHF